MGNRDFNSSIGRGEERRGLCGKYGLGTVMRQPGI